ncbi:MAG: hypothetical protein MHPSP_002637, partial [Paramarteilia canceri]
MKEGSLKILKAVYSRNEVNTLDVMCTHMEEICEEYKEISNKNGKFLTCEKIRKECKGADNN